MCTKQLLSKRRSIATPPTLNQTEFDIVTCHQFVTVCRLEFGAVVRQFVNPHNRRR